MAVGRTLTRLAAWAAVIGGVIFFWRKRQDGKPTEAPAPPTASDTP